MDAIVLASPWNVDAIRAVTQRPVELLNARGPVSRFLLEQFVVPLQYRKSILHYPGNFSPLFWGSGRSIVTLQNPNYFGVGRRYWANRGWKRRLKIRLSRLSVRRAKLVIVISDSLLDEVVADLPDYRAKFRLLQSGGPDVASEVVRVNGVDTPFVLALSNDYPHKRLDWTVRVWSESGIEQSLVMAGAIEQRRRAQLLDGLDESTRCRVRFVGEIRSPSEVGWLLSEADCLLAPSDLEAHPLTPAEAGIYGCPLVLSDIPAHREVASSNAIYVDPSAEAAEWAEALRLGASSPRSRWSTEYSWAEHGRALLGIWNEIAVDSGSTDGSRPDRAISDRTGSRVALIHNILPPYRVDLFNSISDDLDHFKIFFTRNDHPVRRSWAWTFSSLHADHTILRGRHFDWGNRSIGYSVGIREELDAWRPDVVVVAGWDLTASWSAIRWARRHHKRIVVWTEATSYSGQRRGRFSQGMRRLFIGSADAVLVPGVDAERYVASLCPGVPVFRIPNSVSNDDLRGEPGTGGDLGASGSVFVGELSERKGLDLILRLYRDDPSLFGGLEIVGEGPMRPEVEAIVATGVEGLRFHGPLGPVERRSVISSAHMLLLPSRRDPWPLVSVEALCLGVVPVLGTGVGSAEDLAEFGAVRCEGETVEDLRRAMERARTASLDVGRALHEFSAAQGSVNFCEAVTFVTGIHAAD
jgi:glycosyltransferase involved in cell wall biosynthesis